MHFTAPISFYTMGRCLGSLSLTLPLDPTRGSIGGPGLHLWVLALRAQFFSLQAIPKSWEPWLNEFIFDSFIRCTQTGHGEITCLFILLQENASF